VNREAMVSHLGLDNHRAFSRITARDAENGVVWRRRMDHRDREAIRTQMKSWPAGAPVILEGTFGWGWMTDELKACGLEPHLASSTKVAAWRRARGLAKNDRIDGDLLSELWLQQPHWWEVWLAPPEVRQRREWMRYRMALVGMQTALKNRIHAITHCHGIWHGFSDLFGVQGRKFLSLLSAGQEGELPESTRKIVRGYLQLLDYIRRQIAEATRVLRKDLGRSTAGARLRTLPGVGWILGHTILAEVGSFDRFPSGRHLASYSLLVPRACDSGIDEGEDTPIGRHVGHVGRHTLKWAWIEAARTAVRCSSRFRAIYDRRTDGGKRDRNRGCIAVAHEMCLIGYLLETRQVDYQEIVRVPKTGKPKRQRERSSCSVRG
jgi:transposase